MTDKGADRLKVACVSVTFGVLIGALTESFAIGTYGLAAMFCLSRWPERWRYRHVSIRCTNVSSASRPVPFHRPRSAVAVAASAAALVVAGLVVLWDRSASVPVPAPAGTDVRAPIERNAVGDGGRPEVDGGRQSASVVPPDLGARNGSDQAAEATAVMELRAAEVTAVAEQRAAEATAAAEQRAAGQPRFIRDCDFCPELVVISAGMFMMGSSADDDAANPDERPQHLVQVDRFALGRYEVTRGEYAVFASETGYSEDSRCQSLDDSGRWEWQEGVSWHDPGFIQEDRHPVVCVSWEGAQAYVRWLSAWTRENYRLPSESEWEYAARAGTTTAWYWAGNQCEYANGGNVAGCDDGAMWTAPTGSYAENNFRLFDMLGNVMEWVEDCWHDDYYSKVGTAWTVGGDCSRRVLRGGSWFDDPQDLRSATRFDFPIGDRRSNAGFRVARDALD